MKNPRLQKTSHSLDGAVMSSQQMSVDVDDAGWLISKCPYLSVDIGGVQVKYLVDTGSMLSTIMQSFFQKHFEPLSQERLHRCNWLQLKAANGLSIPYVRYLGLDIQLCGKLTPNCGVLVVKDPSSTIVSQAPGVLGMIVL